MKKISEGIEVKMNIGLEDAEIRAVLAQIRRKNSGQILESIELVVGDTDIEAICQFEPVPFDKIRRITGYLVGTVDRFNDGKRAEEKDRIKHSVQGS